jgi:hypothetical protein
MEFLLYDEALSLEGRYEDSSISCDNLRLCVSMGLLKSQSSVQET